MVDTPSGTDAIEGRAHFIDGYSARGDTPGTVRVVIEIPTGTTQKWEVDKADGLLRWEIRDGRPRLIDYLGYPGNYGMVPRTLLASDDGGDGDPLDVLVLGPPMERGAVVEARIIGVLNLLDGGEQDDKLVAVMDDTAFAQVTTIAELRRSHPGVTDIVETWFTSYKGPGEMTSSGYGEAAAADVILTRAVNTYASKAD